MSSAEIKQVGQKRACERRKRVRERERERFVGGWVGAWVVQFSVWCGALSVYLFDLPAHLPQQFLLSAHNLYICDFQLSSQQRSRQRSRSEHRLRQGGDICATNMPHGQRVH